MANDTKLSLGMTSGWFLMDNLSLQELQKQVLKSGLKHQIEPIFKNDLACQSEAQMGYIVLRDAVP